MCIRDRLETARASKGEPVEAGGRLFRRPTGRDQLRWAEREYRTADEAMAEIARTLAVDGRPVEAALMRELEVALDEADPLLCARVRSECPECGRASERELDLIASVLSQLESTQEELFETVHLLASKYHWSEAEILALPQWRRERYRKMLAREER